MNGIRIQTIPEPLDSYFVPVVINSGISNLSQTLLSEKLLKHENPKNNASQMCAVPLRTQGTETGGTLSLQFTLSHHTEALIKTLSYTLHCLKQHQEDL